MFDSTLSITHTYTHAEGLSFCIRSQDRKQVDEIALQVANAGQSHFKQDSQHEIINTTTSNIQNYRGVWTLDVKVTGPSDLLDHVNNILSRAPQSHNNSTYRHLSIKQIEAAWET